MDDRLTRISRVLSHALRHVPGDYGLELDAQGWVDLEELVTALRRVRRYQDLTAEQVEQAVATASKQRHEIRDGRIRAVYGHSTRARIHRDPAQPPAVLYHGTAPQRVEQILDQGILPMRRQYAHLATDVEMAVEVGARHASTPAVVMVDAAAAHRDGVAFYRGSDRIWMADSVPGAYLCIVR